MAKAKQLFLTTSYEDAQRHTKKINDAVYKAEGTTTGNSYAWNENSGDFKHISYSGYNLLNKSQKAAIKKYVRKVVG